MKPFFSVVLFSVSLFLAGRTCAQQVLATPHTTKAVVAVLADEEVGATPAFRRYCQMLETEEGLGVYAVAATWKNPEQVRDVIQLVRQKYPAFEGMVLIGQIPVVLVRNAQHMTTAFKMDELKFHRSRSSVASDRFYDDFDLRFRFVGRDSAQPDWFYYELLETSPQVIRSDCYTGRIMSHAPGSRRVQEISAFLDKAVAARDTPNPLDRMFAFTGGAYNSESITAWLHEQELLEEIMPSLFKTAGGYRPLHFSMDGKMKYRLFSELQRPGLDLALLTEHGDIEKQYINNAPAGDDLEFSRNYLRYYLRDALRRAVEKGQDPEVAKQSLMKKTELPASWFNGALDNDSLRIADSLYLAETNILTPDLAGLRPSARMIIFNACYNGSYHQPGNISAAYLFGDGNTIVTHGNTTNVLQDKWTIEHLGLLQRGIRAGQWSRLNNTLESSLNGDPTYRFDAAGSAALNTALASAGTAAAWESRLSQNDPVLQALALRKLFELKGKKYGTVLQKQYRSSPYRNVRMEALKLLAQTGDTNYITVAGLALHDPYELIRRKSAEWIAKAGHPQFIPQLVDALLLFPEDARLVFNISRCFDVLDWDSTLAVIDRERPAAGFLYNAGKWRSDWQQELSEAKQYAAQTVTAILNKGLTEEARVQRIRLLRNSNYHHLVPQLLPVLADTAEPLAVRQNLVEALGWFSLSYRKPLIRQACEQLLAAPGTPAELKAEAAQTIARLDSWILP